MFAYTHRFLLFRRKSMQTQIHFRANSAFWHSFKWGQIIPEKSLFKVVPRTQKNIFKIFNGLGINEDLLFLLRDLGIKYIEVPFNNSILSTTVNKWIKEGIRSRYTSDKVDRQIILPLHKIFLPESFPVQDQSQLTLFQGVG